MPMSLDEAVSLVRALHVDLPGAHELIDRFPSTHVIVSDLVTVALGRGRGSVGCTRLRALRRRARSRPDWDTGEREG
jgi:hypothetical protein